MVGTYRPNILLNCGEMKVTNNSDSLQYSVMCKKKVFNVPQKSGWSALNNNDWHALKIESSLAGDDCGDQPAALLYSRYPERW